MKRGETVAEERPVYTGGDPMEKEIYDNIAFILSKGSEESKAILSWNVRRAVQRVIDETKSKTLKRAAGD